MKIFHKCVYLTSNKHNCSIQVFLLVCVTHEIVSSRAGCFLVKHCSGIGSPAQSCHIHGYTLVVHLVKDLPLFHNATEGSVGPHRHNSVLGVNLKILNGGKIVS